MSNETLSTKKRRIRCPVIHGMSLLSNCFYYVVCCAWTPPL